MLGFVTLNEASQLLHNKFVVILGGSVQRSMYKDLVLLLQKDTFLTSSQLKSKGEASFEHDGLVEGGSLGPLSNGPDYREVRQYRSEHHLVRYYFLSRVYSPYMESILEDLRGGLKPDLLVVNSSVCDVSSYRCSRDWLPQYLGNLHKFFEQLKAVTTDACIRVWILNTTGHLKLSLQGTAMEANLCSGMLARAYGLDVLDLYYHFRCLLPHGGPHGEPWDGRAQRWASALLLHHVAAAWGVAMSPPPLLGPRPASRAIRGPAGPAAFPSNHLPPFQWDHCQPIRRQLPSYNIPSNPGKGVRPLPCFWPRLPVMRRRDEFPSRLARVHPYQPPPWKVRPRPPHQPPPWKVLPPWQPYQPPPWKVLPPWQPYQPPPWKVLPPWQPYQPPPWKVLPPWQPYQPPPWKVLPPWQPYHPPTWQIMPPWQPYHPPTWKVRPPYQHPLPWKVRPMHPGGYWFFQPATYTYGFCQACRFSTAESDTPLPHSGNGLRLN
ncbi:unnamed protein product [Gadus morhua 'NCC']